jgi:tRNA dimethylallyltransferase
MDYRHIYKEISVLAEKDYNAGTMKKVLFIIGPTAVGKSGLALMLAKELNGEVISADSMQVYKGMDIGTAKPSKAELDAVPHHLIDIISPEKPYNVSDFIEHTLSAIEDVQKRNKLPIVAGGTGMYLFALLEGFDLPEIKRDASLRKALEAEDAEKLHARLEKVDPVTAKRLHINDKKRVIRALEVYELTGKPMSTLSAKGKVLPFEPVLIGLKMDRERLYKRIEARVDEMLKAGLVDEVRALLKKVDPDSTSMQAIGYKEVVKFIKGEWDRAEMVKMLKQNTRNFARRQMTWFRRFKDVKWFDIDNLNIENIMNESCERGDIKI